MKFYRDSYEYFISLQNLIFAYVLKLCRDCDKWYWSVSEIHKYSNSTATYLKYYSLSGVILEDFHYKLSRKKAMYFKEKKKERNRVPKNNENFQRLWHKITKYLKINRTRPQYYNRTKSDILP